MSDLKDTYCKNDMGDSMISGKERKNEGKKERKQKKTKNKNTSQYHTGLIYPEVCSPVSLTFMNYN